MARPKLGEILIEAGEVSREAVTRALDVQLEAPEGRLGELLVDAGDADPATVARALARQHRLEYVELPLEIPERITALVPVSYQLEHRVVPFRLEESGPTERLHLAVDDPTDLAHVEELRFQINKPVHVWVASSRDVDNTLAFLRGDKVEELIPIDLEDDLHELEPLEEGVTELEPLEDADEWDPLADVPDAPASSARVARQHRDRPPPVPVFHFPDGKVRKPGRHRLDFSDDDLRILDELDRKVLSPPADLPEVERVTPERMVAGLVRLLVRKGILNEIELFEELARREEVEPPE